MAKMKIRGLNKLIPKAKIVARQYKMCQVPETPMSLHHPALPYLPVYRQLILPLPVWKLYLKKNLSHHSKTGIVFRR